MEEPISSLLQRMGVKHFEKETTQTYMVSHANAPDLKTNRNKLYTLPVKEEKLLKYAQIDQKRQQDEIKKIEKEKKEQLAKEAKAKQDRQDLKAKQKAEKEAIKIENKRIERENEANRIKEEARQEALKLQNLKKLEQIAHQKKLDQEKANSQALQKEEEQRKREERLKLQRQTANKQRQDIITGHLNSSQNNNLLDMISTFANFIQIGGEINCAINSVGDIKKVTKDILIWTESFIEKVDLSNTDQVNTLCVKLWNVIVNELIMKARKDGIELIPPGRADAEIYKNCINTYCLMINLLRVMGAEKVWLYCVGKTLDLLNFIYKRKDALVDFKDLDLCKKGYIKKFGDNFQNVYISRLDQISYFFFGLLLMNPFDCFMEIGNMTNNFPADVRHKVSQLNKPWDYSIFWMLVQDIRKIPFRYFKPIIYNNMLSILNTQLVEARTSGKNNEFLDIYRMLVDDALQFQKEQAVDPEMKTLSGTMVDGYFDGDDFESLLVPVKCLGKDKKKLLENRNIEEVKRKGSVFYYFKSIEL